MNASIGTENISKTLRPTGFGSHEDTAYRVLTGQCGFLDCGVESWLLLEGKDAGVFLQGMVTQDVTHLQTGASAASWILSPAGKIEVWVLLFKTGTGSFLVRVPEGMAEPVRERLDRYIIMEAVAIEERRFRCVSVQGPEARELAGRTKGLFQDAECCPNDRCGFGGFDLLCEPEHGDALLSALTGTGIAPTEPAALEAARLEAFLPVFGTDMVAGVNPMIYGEGGRISRTKGCYIGQETVAMTRDRGRPPQVLVLLKSDTGEVPLPGTVVQTDGKEVGTLSSASWSPKHRATLAMATVKFGSHETGQSLCDCRGVAWTILKNSHTKAS